MSCSETVSQSSPFFFCHINRFTMPTYPVTETVSQCLLVLLQKLSPCPVTETVSQCRLVLLQKLSQCLLVLLQKLFQYVFLFCYRNCFTMSPCPVTDNFSPRLLVSHILLYNVPVLCETVHLRKLDPSVSLFCYRLYNPYYTYVKTQNSCAKDS